MVRRVPALNRWNECSGSGWSAVISIRPCRRPRTDGEGVLNQPIPRPKPSGWAPLGDPPLPLLIRLRTPLPPAGQRPPVLGWAGIWQWLTARSPLGAHRLTGRFSLSLGLGLLMALVLVLPALPALASPGLCVGPVCGDEFSRSAQYHWQLRLRVNDQQGHRERLVVDCRTGALSPQQGLVERGYASAVARRACRLAAEGNG